MGSSTTRLQDINPLVGESLKDTLYNVTEALDGLIELMAERHSPLCRLLGPIVAALEYEGHRRQNEPE